MKLKHFAILFLSFLTACFSNSTDDVQETVQTLSPTKQKQKIGWLEKKLEIAEREKKKVQTEVERLSTEINQAKLVLIRKQLDEYEKQIGEIQISPQKYPHLVKDEIASLFIQEREALHQIIQDGPSPSSFEAQVELDRILRMITELSEKRESIR